MAKISQKIKEQAYEHLRTNATTGQDLAATTKNLAVTFNLPFKQAASLVGVAKRKGWLTKNAEPEETIKKVGDSETTTPETTTASTPQSSSTMLPTVSGNPAVVTPAPVVMVSGAVNPADPVVLTTEQKRMLSRRPAVDTEPQKMEASRMVLEAFQLLESGALMVDVMVDLSLSFDEAKMILDNYNALKHAEAERSAMDERYLLAWHTVAKVIGENIRDSCEHYQDESGVCVMWDPKDVESQFRKKYPGMFTTVGRRLRFRVLDHSEVCAICHKGI